VKRVVSFAVLAIAAVITVPPPAFACQVHHSQAGNTAAVSDQKCGNIPYVKMQVSALTSGKEDLAARGVRNDSHRSTGTRGGRIFQDYFF
jgi:hypothetical protein